MQPMKILGLIVFAALASFGYYLSLIPQKPDLLRPHDAVIVLTGGSMRIEEGARLVAEGKAPKLFISGVEENISEGQILRSFNLAPEKLFLGRQATDTKENALESGEWMRKNGIKTAILVTSDYHMPRALLEFRARAPGVSITPYPVASASYRSFIYEWAKLYVVMIAISLTASYS